MNGLGDNSSSKLKELVERIEAAEDEKALQAEQIKSIYSEAGGAGFNTKALRALIRQRRQDQTEVEELQAALEAYREALGALASTPLGQSAMAREAGKVKVRS